MALLRLFASAREAAGIDREELDADTVGELLDLARTRYGEPFAAVLATARVWLNGEPAELTQTIRPGDEVAVLPPVSGGAAELPLRAPAPVATPRRRVRRLSLEASGPHARLGLAWMGVVVVAAIAGSPALAVVLAATGTIAALEVVRVRWAHGDRPAVPVSLGGVAVLPFAAAAGPLAAGVVVVLFAAAAAGMAAATNRKTWQRGALLTMTTLPIGLAAASPVLVRRIGLAEPMLLLALAGAYDVGAYLVGTGATVTWEGPAAGIAALIPVVLVSGVVLVPKFPDATPLALGLAAAVLVPLGTLVASKLLRQPDARAPALRRLDSLLLFGPVWAVVLTALRP